MVDLNKEPTERGYGRFGFSLLRKFVIFFAKKFDNNDNYKNDHEDIQ